MRISLVILLSLISITAVSQTARPMKYALSVEVGKTGLLYSVVFDNTLKDPRYGIKAGMGGNFGNYTEAIMGQVGAYRLFGKQDHYFETGIDLHYLSIDIVSEDQSGVSSLIYPDHTTRTVYITLNCGYRVKAGKILFRIGAAPGFTKEEFIPGGYISCGIRF
ncbi:MAG TPA: hypothetical protein VF476_04280 [Chitinophagaceae bacterium]